MPERADEPPFISVRIPAPALRSAGIDALPRAVAFTLDRTTVYLHPDGLDEGGPFNVIGWHTDA